MSALAEVVYREMRKKEVKISEESEAYIYEMPQNLSIVRKFRHCMEIEKNANSVIFDEVYVLMQSPQIFGKLIFVVQRDL